MTEETYHVQKAGLGLRNWMTVYRGPEARAREVYERQLRLYSVGRFRLVNERGDVIEEDRASISFS